MTLVNMRKNTMAVPSLRSDSPSISTESFPGAPSSCKADTTATGSVAARMAPRVSAWEKVLGERKTIFKAK